MFLTNESVLTQHIHHRSKITICTLEAMPVVRLYRERIFNFSVLAYLIILKASIQKLETLSERAIDNLTKQIDKDLGIQTIVQIIACHLQRKLYGRIIKRYRNRTTLIEHATAGSCLALTDIIYLDISYRQFVKTKVVKHKIQCPVLIAVQ